MNILFIGVVELDGGGVGQYIKNIVSNTSVDFFKKNKYFLGSLTQPKDKARYSEKLSFIEFDMRYSALEIYKKVSELRKIIKDNDIDVIHVHGQRAAFIAAICIFNDIRLIYTPHTLRHTQLTGVGRILHRFIERYILSKVDTVTTIIGDTEAKEILRINSKVKIIKVNTSINDSHIKENYSDNITNIIMVGDCNKGKHPNLFVDIAKKLPEKTFTWVGDGVMREEMLKVIKEKSINNIKFVGHKSNEQTKEMVALSDTLLFTSKVEGFPIAILEAFMLKTVVISNNFGTSDKILKNKKTGLIFALSDADGAVNCITRLSENPNLKNQLTKNAYDFFKKDYSSLTKFSSSFVDLYMDNN